MCYNLTVARNPMPMFVWCDRKIDWWIRDAWPKAAMGSTSIVMCDPVSWSSESLLHYLRGN